MADSFGHLTGQIQSNPIKSGQAFSYQLLFQFSHILLVRKSKFYPTVTPVGTKPGQKQGKGSYNQNAF